MFWLFVCSFGFGHHFSYLKKFNNTLSLSLRHIQTVYSDFVKCKQYLRKKLKKNHGWTNLTFCWYRSYSGLFRIRFCYCNKIRRCFLGFSETWNLCSSHGLLLFWPAFVSGLSYCCCQGHSYQWSFFSNFPCFLINDYFLLFFSFLNVMSYDQ